MKFKSRYIVFAFSLVLFAWIIYMFGSILSYVLMAWILSMIGAPLVAFFRKYVGKSMASLLTLVVFALGLVLLVFIFIPPLSKQARNLASIDYHKLIKNLEEPLGDWEEWLDKKGLMPIPLAELEQKVIHNHCYKSTSQVIHLDTLMIDRHNFGDSATLGEYLHLYFDISIPSDHSHSNTMMPDNVDITFFDNIRKTLFDILDPSRIPKLFTSAIGTISSIVIGIFSIGFIAFFFLKEQGLFNRIVASLTPDVYVNQIIHAIEEISDLLIRYFTGILGQMTFVTVFVSILLSILGVKNALLIGFFAALMNVIPYLGPIIGAGFGIMITISSNLDLPFYDGIIPLLIKVLVVFGLMQLVDNFLVQPNIFSKSVKAHPLEIFLVVLIGAQLGGIGGMVLAIPAYTILRVIAKVFLSEFKIVQSITQRL